MEPIMLLVIIMGAIFYGVVAGMAGMNAWHRHKEHQARKERYRQQLEALRADAPARRLQFPDEC